MIRGRFVLANVRLAESVEVNAPRGAGSPLRPSRPRLAMALENSTTCTNPEPSSGKLPEILHPYAP